MKKRLPVAEHLNDSEYRLLLKTYAAHNSSMGHEMRKKYMLENVVKIERGQNCLHVHFANGEWWHYTPEKTWY